MGGESLSSKEVCVRLPDLPSAHGFGPVLGACVCMPGVEHGPDAGLPWGTDIPVNTTQRRKSKCKK